MNLLIVTDKLLADTEHQSNEQFGLWIRMKAKEKVSLKKDSQILFDKFELRHNDFMKQMIGAEAKKNGTQTAALNEIISYLTSQAKEKNVEGIFAVWDYILNPANWKRLPYGIRVKMNLNEISYNLTNIIGHFKNGRGTTKGEQQTIEQSADSIANWDGN